VSRSPLAAGADAAVEAGSRPARDRDADARRIDGLTRDEMCVRYRGRIVATARRLSERLPIGCDLDADDLASFGAIGLLEAFDRFDPSRSILFSTFAEYRIRGAMMDALRQNDSFTRYRRDLWRRIQEAGNALTHELGAPPTPEQVAERLGMDLDSYWQAVDRTATVSHVAFDAPPAEDTEEGARTLAETLSHDDGQGAYRSILHREARGLVTAAIRALPERKRQCIILYYGRGLNLSEIAAVFDVTPSRISQILTAARQELREVLAEELDPADLSWPSADPENL
jgi:RNA polymerase sigma factor for flagellar operon FliA